VLNKHTVISSDWPQILHKRLTIAFCIIFPSYNLVAITWSCIVDSDYADVANKYFDLHQFPQNLTTPEICLKQQFISQLTKFTATKFFESTNRSCCCSPWTLGKSEGAWSHSFDSIVVLLACTQFGYIFCPFTTLRTTFDGSRLKVGFQGAADISAPESGNYCTRLWSMWIALAPGEVLPSWLLNRSTPTHSSKVTHLMTMCAHALQ